MTSAPDRQHSGYFVFSTETATGGVLWEKVFLEILQNLQENTLARVSFLIKLEGPKILKKETLAQVFSYEFCKISKNIFFTEHHTTASISTHKDC